MPIADDVQLGADVRIFQPELVNLYGCSIGDENQDRCLRGDPEECRDRVPLQNLFT